MPVRKTVTPFVVLALASLTLVGCGASPEAGGDCERTTSPGAATEMVTVTGAATAAPRIDAYTPIAASTTQWTDLAEGSGTPITSDSQLAALDLTILDGRTGEKLAATPYDGTNATVYPISRWSQSFPALATSLECARPGARVLTVVGPDGYDAAALAALGLQGNDTLVVVTDVRRVYLGKADGEDEFVAANDLPQVVRAPDGRPGIIVPDRTPPADLQVRVLKEGSGEAVSADAPVRLAYTGVLWADRSVFDTSWDSEPRSIVPSQTVPGFAQALEGQRVGSQLLIVIPPELGYGAAGSGRIPADSTLVFVVDILGLDAAG